MSESLAPMHRPMNISGSDGTTAVNTEPPATEPPAIEENFDFDVEELDLPAPTMQNAAVVQAKTPATLAARLDQLRMPQHSDSLVNMIGRFIMNAVHGVTHLFSKRPVPDVSHLPAKQPRPPSDPNPKDFGPTAIGKALGLQGEINVKPFDKPLYPSGAPSLGDIRQNPALQDCWFLSAVGSLLNAKGPDYIKGLIAEDNDSYRVQLGNNVYTVPKGDLTGADGKKTVSDSAPWVRVLEYAMQAYRLDKSPEEFQAGSVTMSFQSINLGLQALTGSGTQSPGAGENKTEFVRTALAQGKAVVMGHMPKFGLEVFKDGISAGHAVTVLDIRDDPVPGGKAKIAVLDPYGKVHVLDEDVFERSTLSAVDAPETETKTETSP